MCIRKKQRERERDAGQCCERKRRERERGGFPSSVYYLAVP